MLGVTACCTQLGASTSADANALDKAPAAASMAAVLDASAADPAACASISGQQHPQSRRRFPAFQVSARASALADHSGMADFPRGQQSLGPAVAEHRRVVDYKVRALRPKGSRGNSPPVRFE